MTERLAPHASRGPFLAGMSLLVVAVIGCAVSLWFVWTAVFFPEPTNLQRAAEAANLGIIIHETNKMHYREDALKDQLQRGLPWVGSAGPRVREAAQFMLHERRIDWAGMEKLVELQEADVRGWRLRRLFLYALPSLAVGIGAGCFGLRILRGLKPPGTVFAAESQGPVERQVGQSG